MKKIFAILAVCAVCVSASAQQPAYEKGKFFDNWSIGADGGINTNLYNWHKGGGVLGVQLTKAINPVVSFEFSTQLGLDDIAWKGDANSWAIGSPYNKKHISTINAIASTKINLMNWIGGYKCEPRLFEVQARGGVGYLRYVADEKQGNSAVLKVGLDFDFNLGEAKAWTVSLRPAILTDIIGAGLYRDANEEFGKGLFSTMQLTAGLTYHFKNSNGNHYINCVRPYDQSEIDALMANINALREEYDKSAARIRQLEDELAKKPKEVVVEKKVTETKVQTKEEHSLECLVYFGQGKTTISPAQLPNVERIATFMKNNKNSKVVIYGYASPEGNAEVNERIANQRAEAVQKLLVNKYKISADRITAKGKGVGDAFSEPDWNRVSICTIEQ
ncbi:MAG: OmpA family protein [Bacteroidaceae bacterium]|nr:OmpA family protein [Bacteroidaceae bacterium]